MFYPRLTNPEQLPNTKAYIAFSAVCRRLRVICASPPAQRAFARAWFSTHCDDAIDQAPSLLHFFARYIHLHCAKGNGLECCNLIRTPHLTSVSSEIEDLAILHGTASAFRPSENGGAYIPSQVEYRRSWRQFAFSRFSVTLEVQTMEKLERILSQIEREMEKDCSRPPKEGWDIESIGTLLCIPDVAFAEVIYNFNRFKEGHWHRHTPRRGPGNGRADTKDAFYISNQFYLEPMQIIRDTWRCGCVLKNVTMQEERERWNGDIEACKINKHNPNEDTNIKTYRKNLVTSRGAGQHQNILTNPPNLVAHFIFAYRRLLRTQYPLTACPSTSSMVPHVVCLATCFWNESLARDGYQRSVEASASTLLACMTIKIPSVSPSLITDWYCKVIELAEAPEARVREKHEQVLGLASRNFHLILS
ncbi:hypothetical protein BJ508DRAFT_314283 [Ascobolus immersus RN42]|uniref:Uncharacterized protein n=1 Tax=Ascobolus immersus RN42 TaxID=1160509 RepID=A0A3N4HHK5_ASCIM|nr:hypothetical protein BJ508DRAFT_314283 [Ascobolus immersus RN42]